MFRRFKVKLSAVVFLLVAIATAASSVVVMKSMERSSLGELVKKGFSMAESAAEVAGDALASEGGRGLQRIEEMFRQYGEEALFLAAVDGRGRVLAHSNSSMAGLPFPHVEGKVIDTLKDGSTARRVKRASVLNYEFRVPVVSSGKKVGHVFVALDAHALDVARREALINIFLVAAAVMALSVLGVSFLSSRFTAPMEKLSEGIVHLPAASDMEEILISSRHDMGDLTLKFNAMATTIMQQKRELRENADELERGYVATLRLLATVIDARDPYTRGHSARVARMSVLLGRRLGLEQEQLRDLEVASMFHDVGKIKMPDRILNKREPLSEEEHAEMMEHTRAGADILRVVDSLRKYIPAVLSHHEWHDGSGYPDGLKGGDIPLPASIISVTDAYDAMTSARPYRAAMSPGEALREMERFGGRQFDPHILENFVEVVESQAADSTAISFLVGGEEEGQA